MSNIFIKLKEIAESNPNNIRILFNNGNILEYHDLISLVTKMKMTSNITLSELILPKTIKIQVALNPQSEKTFTSLEQAVEYITFPESDKKLCGESSHVFSRIHTKKETHPMFRSKNVRMVESFFYLHPIGERLMSDKCSNLLDCYREALAYIIALGIKKKFI